MQERRQGTHKAVHRLAQVYADVIIAISEVEGIGVDYQFQDRKHRSLCLLREVRDVVRHVVDTDLGLKLIKEDENG